MVRTQKSRKKSAFTMIELIFAIVVIGISVLSLPMIIRATQKGIEENIVQEAIFAASSELIGATAGYWDENSMQDKNTSTLSRVIDLDGDCNSERLRPGHIKQPKHRKCLESNSTTAHNLATNLVDINVSDLNNAAHGDENIFTDTTTDAAGYKKAYQSNVAVNLSGSDSNVKLITATVKDSSGNPIVVLRTQSANIGEIDYYKRSF